MATDKLVDFDHVTDYISREAAEQFICDVCERPGCPILWGGDCDRIDRLNKIPAADVVEVRHGRWVHGREVGREYLGDCLAVIFYDRWTCSECGYNVDDHAYSRINYKFCPNCGAKMDGGVNDATD